MNQYRCPKCKEESGFWQEVELLGWRSVQLDRMTTKEHGRPMFEPVTYSNLDRDAVTYSNLERDVDWSSARSTEIMGCSCGWEGDASDLEVLGWDGKPLDKPLPGQLSLAT